MGKGQQHGSGGAGHDQFQKVRRAVIEHCLDRADLGAAGVDHGQADQVGVVIFVIGQRGQPFAQRKQLRAIERIGVFLAAHAGQPRRKAPLERAGDLNIEAAAAVFGGQRRVIRNRFGIGGKALEADLAMHPEGA